MQLVVKKLINLIIRILTRNMSMSTERMFWFAMEPISRYKFMVCCVFTLGTLTGLFEGISVGLIALSVVVITGEAGECSQQISGVVDFFGLDLCEGFNKESLFIILLLSGAGTQIVKASMQYLTLVVNAHLQSRVVYFLQSKVMVQIMGLHYQEVSQYSAGDKQTLVAYSAGVSTLLAALNSLVITSCTFLAYFVLLVGMSWQLSIFSSIILVVMSVAIVPLIARLADIGKLASHNGLKLAKTSIDYLQAIKLIKLYGNDKTVLSSINAILWRGNKITREGTIVSGLLAPLQETVVLLAGVSVLLMGHFQVFDALSHPLPTLLGYVMVLYRCGGRFAELNGIRANLAKAIPRLEYVANFLRVEDKRFQRTTGVKLPKEWEKIVLNNVDFQYEEKPELVIDGVSLTISRGEKIAIVGRSGSGKSTLIDLVAGLNDPTGGAVCIGGISSIEAHPTSWFSHFSVVSQNDLILDGSIMHNLLFAAPNAKEAEIVAACKIANAHEFISEMEMGYESQLGERGINISGGQLQRIALARAILKDASVLILDEATSALDVLSEKKIMEAVHQLDRNRTVLMIAHRLSTVVKADRIVVLDEGKIVEQGSHNELRRRNGLYQEMWDAQSNGESVN